MERLLARRWIAASIVAGCFGADAAGTPAGAVELDPAPEVSLPSTGALPALPSPAPAPVTATCPDADVPVAALSAARRRAAMRCALGQERRRVGLGRVRAHRALDRAATAHTADMVRRRYFAHVTPERRTLGDRLARAGVGRPALAGETLAWSCGAGLRARDAVRGWLASPGHRRVILHGRFSHVGVGVRAAAPRAGCAPGVTWTLVLARF